MAGSLVVVGTGIRAVAHMTLEAKAVIENADVVLHYVADLLTLHWIERLNPSCESLAPFYKPGKDRRQTYAEMVERILFEVRKGVRVCAVFYGHPGVFVTPSHHAVRLARKEGFPARMLPGISAEDCLFADLCVDPRAGCQSFEATAFLVHSRRPDTTSILILWQIGVLGQLEYRRQYERRGLEVLAEVLEEHYGPNHDVVVYEASQYPVTEPRMDQMPLELLSQARVSSASTLYVPPRDPPSVDTGVLERLDLDLAEWTGKPGG